MTRETDQEWMEKALELARNAQSRGEIPVGALIVYTPPGAEGGEGPEPQLVGTGYNLREAECDPTAHAEIVALRQAGKTLGQWRLQHCTMYVTLEPCPMCAGAIVNARLPRLVYAAPDPKAGAVDSLYHLCTDLRLNHRLTITSGICAAESAALLKSFFRHRRKPIADRDPIG